MPDYNSEIEFLRKDAERYRYLRQTAFIWSDFKHIANSHRTVVGLEFKWLPTEDERPTRESLDAAIDAAMKS